MMERPIDIATLAKLLERCSRVARFNSQDEPEAWRLAHALVDISESCDKIRENLMPALARAKHEQAIEDALHDIGEEFRHIRYHLKTSRFYNYIEENEA